MLLKPCHILSKQKTVYVFQAASEIYLNFQYSATYWLKLKSRSNDRIPPTQLNTLRPSSSHCWKHQNSPLLTFEWWPREGNIGWYQVRISYWIQDYKLHPAPPRHSPPGCYCCMHEEDMLNVSLEWDPMFSCHLPSCQPDCPSHVLFILYCICILYICCQ